MILIWPSHVIIKSRIKYRIYATTDIIFIKHIEKESADFLFSCPPYWGLEKYNGGENDLSGMGYRDFLDSYTSILVHALFCLKNNRFAVIVIGDVRDKNGNYVNLVGETKRIMIDAGASLYNEIILLEQSGTGAMRAEHCMKNRKVVKTHQNILVFFKGDNKTISDSYNKIDIADLETAPAPQIVQATMSDLPDIMQYRKQYVKQKFIMYLNTAILDNAVAKGQIHIALTPEGAICGYVWINNMPRKEVSKIEEICSSLPGTGSALLAHAESLSVFSEIVLEVVDFNHNARVFYEKKGYTVSGEKKGDTVTNICMSKKNESADI